MRAEHQYFPPIHPEGRKWVIISAVVALAFFWFGFGFLAVITGLLAAFCGYFFRDPRRIVPQVAGAAVSPADGTVDGIETTEGPSELGLDDREFLKISVFLSVFDVHINRMPLAGKIDKISYVRGAFGNAAGSETGEENERNLIKISDDNETEFVVVQIAGMIARRILCWVSNGDRRLAGERIGMIRFGSRVDLYVPTDYAPQVALGQKVIGGETILARRDAEALDAAPDEPFRS